MICIFMAFVYFWIYKNFLLYFKKQIDRLFLLLNDQINSRDTLATVAPKEKDERFNQRLPDGYLLSL